MLHEPCQNSHHATTKAIWHTRSHEKVGREFDRCSQYIAGSTKHMWKNMFTWSRPLLRLPQKREPEASEVLHLPNGIIIMSKINNDNNFTKLSFQPCQNIAQFAKYCACHEKRLQKPPLSLTHACQRFSSATQVPRLPATGMEKCPMSCTWHAKRRFSDPKMSRKRCACHHCSKNEHGVLVKRHLQKGRVTTAALILCEPAQSKCTWTFHKGTFVRACANETNNPQSVPWSNAGLWLLPQESISVDTLFRETTSAWIGLRPIKHLSFGPDPGGDPTCFGLFSDLWLQNNLLLSSPRRHWWVCRNKSEKWLKDFDLLNLQEPGYNQFVPRQGWAK